MTRHSPQDLGLRPWPSLRADRPLVLVPVGSVEQHGPHLPLATDAIVAAAVAREAARVLAARGAQVVVAPTAAYGASGEHEGFPGTMSIGHEALHAVLVELGRSACRWAAGVVFVNGHGGNVPTLKKAVELLRYEGRAVAWTSCDLPGADAHAGRTETSLLLNLTPDVVVVDDIEAGCTTPVTELMPRLRAEGVAAVAPNGVLGDPRGSTAEEGARLFALLVDLLVAELTTLEVVGAGRLSSVAADAAVARSEAAP